MFPLPSGKPDFFTLEEAVLQFWKEFQLFEKSVELRDHTKPFRFYDGPPFITGMPHYGSLLSSIIKDVVPRYQTMIGKRVERVWGWDCHGLPIEQKVQKKLGLESNRAIEESEGGIQQFIDECYKYTKSTSEDWNWYIDHIGRWVDMRHAYRTMDQDYMESVLWVFSEIWKKGYVYEGKRVSWYSWKLSTPISNFEIAMDDSYEEVQDAAVTIKFPLLDVQRGGAAIIQDTEGKILMLKNKKDGLWRFIGGSMEAGESFHDCARRELLEETGITCELTPYCTTYLGYRGEFCEALTFRGTVPVGTKVVLEEGYSEYEYFSLDALPIRSEIHRMEHDLLDYLTDIRQPLIIPELPEARTVNILAWTTTPWTLPAHMALAVNRDIRYVCVWHNDEVYIVAESRVETVFKGKGEYTVFCTLPGEELLGLTYKPPFTFYVNEGMKEGRNEENGFETAPLGRGVSRSDGGLQGESGVSRSDGGLHQNHKSQNTFSNSFRIYHADFVTDTDGTGIAHEAPEFGDVDFQLAKKEGIHITSALDKEGKYTAEIPDYVGKLYLDCIDPICERLKLEGTLFKKESITHRVPYCPRSNTPLVQKAQTSWFVDIARIKKELIEQNEHISWFPDHFKHGRFLNSLETAPDWCISRSRFWGTPMPVWQSEDGSERVVIASREELYQKNKPLKQLTKLVFVRHAQSEANAAMIYDDADTAPLSAKGLHQAEELVHALKKEGIDVILCSPYLRTRETIRPFAESAQIEVEILDDLREINHGKYSASPWSSVPLIEHEKMKADYTYRFGEIGENINDLIIRANRVIEHIRATYPGKTVAIVSHKFPLRAFFATLTGTLKSRITHTIPHIVYLDNNTGKELNLHRPTIDRIFLPKKSEIQSTKYKGKNTGKVLGIHGFKRTDKVIDFFEGTKKVLAKQGIIMDTPDFEVGDEVHYKNWEKILDRLDIGSYGTWITHSMGAKIARQYIVDHKLHLKRLIFVAPRYERSTRPEMQKEEEENLTHSYEDLRSFVDEILVVASQDDSVHGEDGFTSSKKVAEAVGARFIGLDGWGHFNVKGCEDIEKILLSSQPETNNEVLKRIPEVLDVWMDSASMPYAQVHYPFENIAKMEASFPADFIAEYTGQIRAWFYVMHVVGVLVKDSPAFKNVVVTGVIKGTDGRKMSKSFGNYPDPRETIKKYGADAIRFYLMSGPIMRGEDMNFSETGIQESIKRVLLPLWNAYTFFATYANIDGWSFEKEKREKAKKENRSCAKPPSVKGGAEHQRGGGILHQENPQDSLIQNPQSLDTGCSSSDSSFIKGAYTTTKSNELDIWIISQLHTLIAEVKSAMDTYDIDRTCDSIVVFLDRLNNWYIRRNRRRFWRCEIDDDKNSAYETLHEVLTTVCQLLAPICPFLTEYLYRCLVASEKSADSKLATVRPIMDRHLIETKTLHSVHLSDFPTSDESKIHHEINRTMTDLQSLTNLGLAIRGREKIRVRQPLREAVISQYLDKHSQDILAEELNVKEIRIVKNIGDFVTITHSPDAKKIGATDRKQWMKTILTEAKAGKGRLTENGELVIQIGESEIILASDEFETIYTPKEGSTIAFAGNAGYVIGLDTTLDETLLIEGYARDMVRAIQDARKTLQFKVTDRLSMQLRSENPLLSSILETHRTMIERETLTQIVDSLDLKSSMFKEVEIDEGFTLEIGLMK